MGYAYFKESIHCLSEICCLSKCPIFLTAKSGNFTLQLSLKQLENIDRVLQTSSIKGQILSILGFEDLTVSITITHLWLIHFNV